MLRPYRPVLAVPGSLRLFASALVARMPQGMSTLAILLLVRDETHSYPAAGAAVGAFTFATAAMAPVLGRLVDRIGRRRVLAPAALAQAVLLVCLVLAARGGAAAWLLVCLAGAAGAFLPPIAPTVRALLREVMVDPTVRERAYALESVAQELVWIAGPLVVALVISVVSPTAAVLLVGAVCVLGTFLFLRSPLAADRPQTAPHAPRSASALANSRLRVLLAPIALMGAALGATEVGIPSLALHAGSRSASGLLLALWSIGSISGGLWYGARAWRSSMTERYRVLLAAGMLLTAPLMVARSLPVGAACSLLAGLAIAPAFSCQYALVGRAADAGTETEAFTWVTAALVGGIAAGSAAGGAVIGADGVGAPFVLACLAMALAAVLALAVREEEGSVTGADLRPLRLVRPLRSLVVRQRLR